MINPWFNKFYWVTCRVYSLERVPSDIFFTHIHFFGFVPVKFSLKTTTHVISSNLGIHPNQVMIEDWHEISRDDYLFVQDNMKSYFGDVQKQKLKDLKPDDQVLDKTVDPHES